MQQAWRKRVVVIFFKKGKNTLLKNYTSITLLSHIYKLFSRFIVNRLISKLIVFQAPKQADFWKSLSTISRRRTNIRRGKLYRSPRSITNLYMLSVCGLRESLLDRNTGYSIGCLEMIINYRDIEVLRCLYKNATFRSEFETNPTAKKFIISSTIQNHVWRCLQTSGRRLLCHQCKSPTLEYLATMLDGLTRVSRGWALIWT